MDQPLRRGKGRVWIEDRGTLQTPQDEMVVNVSLIHGVLRWACETLGSPAPGALQKG